MAVSNYGKIGSGRYKRRKKRITVCVVCALAIIAAAGVIGVLTSNGEGYLYHVSLVRENNDLKAQTEDLQARLDEAQAQITELQGQIEEQIAYIATLPSPTDAPTQTTTPVAPVTGSGLR